MRIALGAIAKNEAPYLLEWIAWHRLQGFDDIIICDNDSTDGSGQLLAALEAAGCLHYLPFPDPPERRPQLPAYEAILKRMRGRADWLALFDLDEFLLPTGQQDLRSILAQQPAKSGGVIVNWALFGSNGLTHADPRLVTERFLHRAAQDFRANYHVKSILRVTAIDDINGLFDPHAAPLKHGLFYSRANGQPTDFPTSGAWGLSAEVNWDGLRLNHYAIKSRQEFLHIKRARGDAMQARKRPTSLFSILDRNEIFDQTADRQRAACQREMARLLTLARDHGGLAPDWAPSMAPAQSPTWGISALYWLAQEGCYVLDGWYRDPNGFAPSVLSLCSPDGAVVGLQSRALSYRIDTGTGHRDDAQSLSGLRVWFHGGKPPGAGALALMADEEQAASLTPQNLPCTADLPPPPGEIAVTDL